MSRYLECSFCDWVTPEFLLLLKGDTFEPAIHRVEDHLNEEHPGMASDVLYLADDAESIVTALYEGACFIREM